MITAPVESLGLYIHLPYCRYRCPYCDFNKYPARNWPEDAYVEALAAELVHYARSAPWKGAAVGTIFFGGGTPSLFSPSSIRRITAAVRGELAVAQGAEVTLEANPETLAPETLAGFRDAGINRLSIGVQSFRRAHLRTLGRHHSPEEAQRVVREARSAGFENISLDLIFAIPGQRSDEWAEDLETAIRLAPDHISTYGLTYEKGTPFYTWREKGRVKPVSEDEELEMYLHAQGRLEASGYAQYEISNFARPGRECRHNLDFWQGGSYLGLGAGAHSFARSPEWGRRWSNRAAPEDYMCSVRTLGHARATEETLDREQAIADCLLLGLRLRAGLSERSFRARFGRTLVAERPAARWLREEGLLEWVGDLWRLSPRALPIADSVLEALLAP